LASVHSVDQVVTGVRGDLLLWAREEQARTMRWVRQNGGPSPGYQSEVEHGAKTEVGSELLAAWVKALQITESFARGQVPVFHDQPGRCRGLAGHVVDFIISGGPGEQNWVAFSPMERTRRVLQLITRPPSPLPRVVLAKTLGVSLKALDAMMLGQLPILPVPMRAVAELTALPEGFFKFGVMPRSDEAELLDRFLPALRLAEKAGITPEELHQLAASRLWRR